MERFAATSDALTRCGRYATSFSAAPSASSAANGAPQRQVVKWYCSLCHTARANLRIANSAHTASVSDPTTPVGNSELLTIAAISPGHRMASSSARRRRPGQYVAFGTGARAYNNHMIKGLGRHTQRARCRRCACKPTIPIAELVHRTVTVCYRAARLRVLDRSARPEESSATNSTGNVVMQLHCGQGDSSALYVRRCDPVSSVIAANARCLWTLTNPRRLPASASPAPTVARSKSMISSCSRSTKYMHLAALHAGDGFTCCSPSAIAAARKLW